MDKSEPKSDTNGRGKLPPRFYGKGDPRNGRGPKKGAPNAGRPPSAFLAKLASILTRDEVLQRFEAALTNPETEWTEFKDAFDRASDRVLGRPTQRQELTGADGGPIETNHTTESPREHLVRELARIARRRETGDPA